ncbi:hypothetical protein HMPREF1142_0808 [Peptostreptococcaceae bacterium AS15]|nr:hypothetical protein HMPREF1142_0808 [Peptostreptococcaceae bacterium AS15]
MGLECREVNILKKEDMDDFLNVTDSLYDKNYDVFDKEEIKTLIEGMHTFSLCNYVWAFCIYKDSKPVGRFALTSYFGAILSLDRIVYIGFVECINDEETFKFLLTKASEFAVEHYFKRIIGPVDISFWVRYRLKVNNFADIPYTGEPYNLPYYYDHFLKSGYEVIETYTTSFYKSFEKGYTNKKLEKRYRDFINKGYVIRKFNEKNFNMGIREIYHLITKLYKNFPIYKEIAEEDFCEYFGKLRTVLNFDMVKMAYYNDEPVGFFIAIPNYNNLTYHIDNFLNVLKILFRKKFTKEYVFLYMGVEEEHRGLGSAIVYNVVKELEGKGITSIGSLVHANKASKCYDNRYIYKRNKYVLLSKNIDNILYF